MKSTGYILNGVYQKAQGVPQLETTENSTYKAYSHDRGREDHRRDLIQPYGNDGKPNAEFIEQYPEEARNYGFTKE